MRYGTHPIPLRPRMSDWNTSASGTSVWSTHCPFMRAPMITASLKRLTAALSTASKPRKPITYLPSKYATMWSQYECRFGIQMAIWLTIRLPVVKKRRKPCKATPDRVQYMNVATYQVASVAASLIPFLNMMTRTAHWWCQHATSGSALLASWNRWFGNRSSVPLPLIYYCNRWTPRKERTRVCRCQSVWWFASPRRRSDCLTKWVSIFTKSLNLPVPNPAFTNINQLSCRQSLTGMFLATWSAICAADGTSTDFNDWLGSKYDHRLNAVNCHNHRRLDSGLPKKWLRMIKKTHRFTWRNWMSLPPHTKLRAEDITHDIPWTCPSACKTALTNPVSPTRQRRSLWCALVGKVTLQKAKPNWRQKKTTGAQTSSKKKRLTQKISLTYASIQNERYGYRRSRLHSWSVFNRDKRAANHIRFRVETLPFDRWDESIAHASTTTHSTKLEL